jgi:hypothetical protein
MENLSNLAQLIVSISVIIVWVFRRDNISIEFKQYGLSNLLQNIVGAVKISLGTILTLGICYTQVKDAVIISSLLMAFLMICAQYYHAKVSNPWPKFMPSIALLILCLFIAATNYGLI